MENRRYPLNNQQTTAPEIKEIQGEITISLLKH